jgi:hypothetical protein
MLGNQVANDRSLAPPQQHAADEGGGSGAHLLDLVGVFPDGRALDPKNPFRHLSSTGMASADQLLERIERAHVAYSEEPTLAAGIRCGQLLIELKAALARGAFGRTVEEELGISRQAANRLMRVARTASDEPDRVASATNLTAALRGPDEQRPNRIEELRDRMERLAARIEAA